MARIYKTTDRIKYKISEEIEISISPLSYHDKNTIFQLLKGPNANELDVVRYALKASLKSISGLFDSDNNEYKLQFEENGKLLSDECVEDLLNLELSNKITQLCGGFINGVPQEDMLPSGVSLVKKGEEQVSPN